MLVSLDTLSLIKIQTSLSRLSIPAVQMCSYQTLSPCCNPCRGQLHKPKDICGDAASFGRSNHKYELKGLGIYALELDTTPENVL